MPTGGDVCLLTCVSVPLTTPALSASPVGVCVCVCESVCVCVSPDVCQCPSDYTGPQCLTGKCVCVSLCVCICFCMYLQMFNVCVCVSVMCDMFYLNLGLQMTYYYISC